MYETIPGRSKGSGADGPTTSCAAQWFRAPAHHAGVRIIARAHHWSCQLPPGRPRGGQHQCSPSLLARYPQPPRRRVCMAEGLQWCLWGVPAALLRIVVQRAPQRGHLGGTSCHVMASVKRFPRMLLSTSGYLRVPSLPQTGTQSSIPQTPPRSGIF